MGIGKNGIHNIEDDNNLNQDDKMNLKNFEHIKTPIKRYDLEHLKLKWKITKKNIHLIQISTAIARKRHAIKHFLLIIAYKFIQNFGKWIDINSASGCQPK